MEETQGNHKGYKSAFLLFYINADIKQQIEMSSIPIYKPEFAQKIILSQELQNQIKMDNYKFELEQQSYMITQLVEKIHQTFKERFNRFLLQQENLDQIVELKIYSFC